MGKGRENFSEEKFLLPFPNLFPLNFRNDRNHNRIASYDLAEEAPQGGTDAIAKARDAEPRRSFEMVEDKTLGILKQMAELLLKHEALGNHVRAVDDLAGLLVHIHGVLIGEGEAHPQLPVFVEGIQRDLLSMDLGCHIVLADQEAGGILAV